MVALLLVLALLLAAAPAAASAPAGSAPANARLVACHRSPALEERVAVVGAWMRPFAAGRRLALRIDLWQRTPGGRWTLRDDVPGLGTWIAPSDPGVGSRGGDLFRYRQAVGRLVVPAAYRFRVAFRWLDADGAVVREASVTTRACRQPDLRPDLVLQDVRLLPVPDAPGRVRYELRVGNAGRAAVARAAIAATFPGEGAPGGHVRHIGPLRPGETVVVAFSGPGCADGALPAAFFADPANTLDEAHETNNELAASCPAP